MNDSWYKNAIIYSLNVETFMDSDGDGVGDFAGLTQRLDYLSSLGVTCLWLLPFYPSPNRDNGYDITDYYNVNPRVGTLGDFVQFVHQAREYGIRVVIDMVINHTSHEHPWFQASRSDKNSKYRNYYIWTEELPEERETEVAFPNVEDDIWEYDEKAGAYYLHHFYKEQPDLNIGNPAVREEICKIMGFWLELGVSGFRLDAAHYLVKAVGPQDTNAKELECFLPTMRSFISQRRGDAILLAEADVDPDEISLFFGDENRMHMLFNFLLNQYMFLSLARQDASGIQKGLKILPEIPDSEQWLNFIRHHDELNLGKLTEEELEEVFKVFAPDEDMRIYGRGIRRRLPPILKGDRRRVELTYSLLFSLPGTPLIRYGEEIGMGDDLSLEGRGSVRTVMQWSNEKNGGFSTAEPDALARPIISDGEYGYKQVNVMSQQPDRNSLLNWTEQVIRIRKQCPQFGYGDWHILETDNPAVFAHYSEWQDKAAIAVHNLADKPCTITLNLNNNKLSHVMDLFGDSQYEAIEASFSDIALNAYGYRWFRGNIVH